MVAERKYTDRDVREDIELEELAYTYLDEYGGDFDPLVKAQQVLKNYGVLPTNLVRVVLNCMRHDWNVAASMPEPLAQVIDMPVRTKTKKSPRKYYPTYEEQHQPCGNTELHRGHNYDGKDWNMVCDGVDNGREWKLLIPARIKVPYVKARGGKMIHLVKKYSEYNFFEWHPNRYGPGFEYGWKMPDPDLSVETMCRYPSVIRRGILLGELPDKTYNADGSLLGLCRHCKKEAGVQEIEARKEACPQHAPVQHRDARPPWCNKCGLTAGYEKPVSRLKEME